MVHDFWIFSSWMKIVDKTNEKKRGKLFLWKFDHGRARELNLLVFGSPWISVLISIRNRVPRERWSRSFTMVILLWQYCRRNISSPAIYCRARGKGNIKESKFLQGRSHLWNNTLEESSSPIFHQHLNYQSYRSRLNVDRNSCLY